MADDIRLVIGVDDRDLIRTQKEQKKFERNLLTIESALRSGQINSNRYTSELNKQAKQLSRLGGTYKKANSEVRTYAASIRKLTNDQLKLTMAQNVAGKSTNKFGMYAQQVGYQVGDFFVQVQSGTSALVAFGQQGTQLAGLLPGVTGAVVGIGLSVGTMLLRSFNDASGASKTFSKALEETETALKDYTELTEAAAASTTELSESFGIFASSMKIVLEDLKTLGRQEAIKKFEEQINNLSVATQSWRGVFVTALNGSAEGVKLLTKELGLTVDQYIELSRLSQATKSGPIEDRVQAAIDLRDVILETTGGIGNMTTKMSAYYTELLRSIETGAELKQTIDTSLKVQSVYYDDILGSAWGLADAEAARYGILSSAEAKLAADNKRYEAAQNKVLERQNAQRKKANDSAKLELKTLSDKNLLLLIAKKDGKDSELYRRTALKIEKEALKARLEAKGVNGVIIAQFVAQLDAQDKYLHNADKTAANYEDILGSSKGLASSEQALNKVFEGKLGTIDDTANTYEDILGSSQGLKSSEDALNKMFEDSRGTLDTTANTYVDILGSSEGLEASTQILNWSYQEGLDKLKAQKEQMFQMRALAATFGTGVGGEFGGVPTGLDPFGGKGDYRYDESSKFDGEAAYDKNAAEAKAAANKKDPVAEFQKQLDLERELLGVSEARAKVLQALGLDFVNKNPEIVAGMEVQINKTLEQMELDRKRQSLIDSVNDSIEDGFMAMSDGTKSVSDAFRTMAAEIVRELYKVYVMQVAIKALKLAMGIPFADGGVISGGSEVKAYANGGVVGGPTTFPMAGGKTGLMGEAGPEAIMPLKRGANGKLGVQAEGGSGDIYVTNNYSISANTSEDTKRLVTQTIQQAQPALTQAAKASIMNDRRRGGQMKSVFG